MCCKGLYTTDGLFLLFFELLIDCENFRKKRKDQIVKKWFLYFLDQNRFFFQSFSLQTKASNNPDGEERTHCPSRTATAICLRQTHSMMLLWVNSLLLVADEALKSVPQTVPPTSKYMSGTSCATVSTLHRRAETLCPCFVRKMWNQNLFLEKHNEDKIFITGGWLHFFPLFKVSC